LAYSHQRAPRFGPPGPGRPQTTNCGLGSFAFFGFDRDAIPTTLGRFDHVAAGRPPLLTLEDVLFVPRLRCLYDAQGQLIEESKVTYIEPGAPAWFNDGKISKVEQESMPSRIDPPAALQRIKEPVLFLGEAHDHYGHFITDSLARMWALEALDPRCKVLFAPDPKRRLEPAYVRLVLGQLGLDAGRVLRPQTPVLFERLYCPIPALQLSRIYQAFDEPHLRAARALTAQVERPDRPVYLTRSGLAGSLRRPRAEEELERRLEREGYRIVQPEQLDLLHQMALFNGEHPVVGAFGSAMHTVLFRARPDGQRLAVLFPEKIPPRFMMVDAIKGSQAAYLNCMGGEATVTPEGGPGERNWLIDCELAMAQLEAAGLLGG
jgi:capsular polysaccharide biosynthesis protein